MISVSFAIPGDLAALTGGYGYDRRVLAMLPRHGVEVTHIALPDGFPNPSANETDDAIRLIASAPGAVVLIDGLAYGVLPARELAKLGRPLVALVHHPLGYESGLTPERRPTLITSERAALDVAATIIVTSPSTKTLLIEAFEIKAEKICIAVPGTDPAPRASGGDGKTTQLLAVGAIIPRKAYDVLVEALLPVTHLDWNLSIAGSLTRAPEATADLIRRVDVAGLASRIHLLGEVDTEKLDRLYGLANIFVMPSLFEGYGMALAEALAHGLPIISTTGGAAAETVPDAAALKVVPGDADALSKALAVLIADKDMRGRLAEASWNSGQTLPRWDDTAARIAETLKRVVSDAGLTR